MKDLDYIDQIIMELHFSDISPENWGQLDIFRGLMEKFIPVNFHQTNYACFKEHDRGLLSKAVEVTFINKKLIKKLIFQNK